MGHEMANDWDPKARDLFGELMRVGPPELRDSSLATVEREAERRARERGAPMVEGVDVARACLCAAPVEIRPRVAENLASHGFDARDLLGYVDSQPAFLNSSFDSEWDALHAQIITHHDEVRRILGLRKIAETPLRVLDLACGTGQHLLEFARAGHRCHGIDIQQWKLDKAAKRARSEGFDIGFTCGDFKSVELVDDALPGGVATAARFDLVVCLYALSVMCSDDAVMAALHAARRALAPDGVFVFNVINKAANTDPSHGMYRSVHVDHHLRDFTREELADRLSQAGLRLQSHEYTEVMGVTDLDLIIAATHAEIPRTG